MALPYLSYDPVADVDWPLGLVHGLHQVAAMGTQKSKASLDVARLQHAPAALGKLGATSRVCQTGCAYMSHVPSIATAPNRSIEGLSCRIQGYGVDR